MSKRNSRITDHPGSEDKETREERENDVGEIPLFFQKYLEAKNSTKYTFLGAKNYVEHTSPCRPLLLGFNQRRNCRKLHITPRMGAIEKKVGNEKVGKLFPLHLRSLSADFGLFTGAILVGPFSAP